MKEVQQIRRSGSKAFDAVSIEAVNRRKQLGLGATTAACIEKGTKRELVLPRLVDIWNP
jgi:hypothetical protein